MKKLLSLLVAAVFAAVSFSAAAQAPAPSSDTPAATEKKAPKKVRKAKKAKKAKKTDDMAAPAATK